VLARSPHYDLPPFHLTMESSHIPPHESLTETENSTIVCREAGAPFADEDADLILRSADSIDFKVHKIILQKAFQLFDDMLVCLS
jgi:hypothetical protein